MFCFGGGGVYDEFADKTDVQSFICRKVSKSFRRNTPLWLKRLIFATKNIFPEGVSHSPHTSVGPTVGHSPHYDPASYILPTAKIVSKKNSSRKRPPLNIFMVLSLAILCKYSWCDYIYVFELCSSCCQRLESGN